MIKFIIYTLLTILFAPFVFWLLSYTIYSKLNLKKYPTQINDGIGDIVFLPLFNGIFAELYTVFNLKLFFISLLISFILTIIYVNYQKNLSDYLDWSKPSKEKLNFGGWYHSFYMLIQITIIFYALILFYNNIYLWLMLILYLLLSLIQILKHGYT